MDKPAPKNSGHGWVYPSLDGSRSPCGGPTICMVCAEEQRELQKAGAYAKSITDNQYTDAESVLAQLLEALKGQLLIVLVNRLGGEVKIPVSEIDGTGQFMLDFEVNQDTGEFTFRARKKD